MNTKLRAVLSTWTVPVLVAGSGAVAVALAIKYGWNPIQALPVGLMVGGMAVGAVNVLQSQGI